MRVVVDLQGCQTKTSKDRGIGRYSFALAMAMARNAGKHEIWLALNGDFGDTIEPICAAFDGLVPRRQIQVFETATVGASLPMPKAWRRRAQEVRREVFIRRLKPDFVHVSSLFEGSDAVTSIGRRGPNAHQAVTLYDLIPLLNPTMYLKSAASRDWYMNKLESAKRADLLLAISEASRQDALNVLGSSPDGVVNISGAADAIFQPMNLTRADEDRLRTRYGLVGPYIMYTGGADERKNIIGLIEAYAAMPMDLRQNHRLVIVCEVSAADRAKLNAALARNRLGPNEVIFVGFVPDEDLVGLYNLCTMFVFPSLHEGFGLPVLEAMSCGAPAIGADNSSIPEVVGLDAALFNGSCPNAIAQKITAVLRNEDFRHALSVHGLKQAKLFSWDKSATRVLTAMENVRFGQVVSQLVV